MPQHRPPAGFDARLIDRWHYEYDHPKIVALGLAGWWNVLSIDTVDGQQLTKLVALAATEALAERICQLHNAALPSQTERRSHAPGPRPRSRRGTPRAARPPQ